MSTTHNPKPHFLYIINTANNKNLKFEKYDNYSLTIKFYFFIITWYV